MLHLDFQGWVQVIVATLFSFYVINKTIPILIKLAYRLNIYDKPDGERKVHTSYISNLGGIAIFIAFIFGFLFSGVSVELEGLPYFTGALLALFFCGLKDDLVGLSPKTKLLIEVASGIAVIFGMGLTINSFGGVFGISQVPYFLSALITLFTIIVVVNSFNLIDGIDGLAGGVSAISSGIFCVGFFIADDYLFGIMSFILSIVSIGYLRHNRHPAKIFMGDTGSLVIGFVLSIIAIRFIGLSTVSGEFQNTLGTSSVIIPIAALSIPLYDTLRVFARRIARGQSPFSADSDHVHHTLLKMGLGQKRTVYYLYGATIAITLVSIVGSMINPNINLLLVVTSMTLLLPTVGIKRRLALSVGINVNRLLSPNKPVDTYNHLEVKNNRKIRQEKKEVVH